MKDIRNAQGQHITRLYSWMWERHVVDITVPDELHLFNFVIEGDGVNLLVLDNYGDDTLPDGIQKRVFGMDYGEYTVAVDRATGELHIITLIEDEDGTLAFVSSPWMNPSWAEGERYRIPRRWVKRLDELLYKKRPYLCHVDPYVLQNFIDQQVGYNQVTEAIVFTFNFDGYSIEVQGDNFRLVSGWRIVEPAKAPTRRPA